MILTCARCGARYEGDYTGLSICETCNTVDSTDALLMDLLPKRIGDMQGVKRQLYQLMVRGLVTKATQRINPSDPHDKRKADFWIVTKEGGIRLAAYHQQKEQGK